MRALNSEPASVYIALMGVPERSLHAVQDPLHRARHLRVGTLGGLAQEVLHVQVAGESVNHSQPVPVVGLAQAAHVLLLALHQVRLHDALVVHLAALATCLGDPALGELQVRLLRQEAHQRAPANAQVPLLQHVVARVTA